MKFKPIRAEERDFSTVFDFSFFSFSYKALSIVLVVVFVGTGMVFASENSLPGDVLYPVKLSFNEGVREALTSTPQSKALLQLEFLNERLEEAQRLAARDELDEEKTEMLLSSIAKHAESEQKELAKVQPGIESNNLEFIALKVEGTVRAHEKALEVLNTKEKAPSPTEDSSSSGESDDFGAEKLDQQNTQEAQKLVEGSEGETLLEETPEVGVTNLISVEELPEIENASEKKTRDRLNLAQKDLANVSLLLSENEEKLLDTQAKEAKQTIRLMESVLVDGLEDFKQGDFLLASRKFKYIILHSEEARSYINILLNTDIEIKTIESAKDDAVDTLSQNL